MNSTVATIVTAEEGGERENRGNKSSKRCQVAQVAIADKQKTTTTTATGDKLYTTVVPCASGGWGREGQKDSPGRGRYDR